ncbi:Uncharacterized protein HZ326_29863 [Fusarium oxysporum f. sp. albedinis]|nr:Uncharacterized protein HZ326_29863 [Fusarium oxysporum f. sp. albedinis]
MSSRIWTISFRSFLTASCKAVVKYSLQREKQGKQKMNDDGHAGEMMHVTKLEGYCKSTLNRTLKNTGESFFPSRTFSDNNSFFRNSLRTGIELSLPDSPSLAFLQKLAFGRYESSDISIILNAELTFVHVQWSIRLLLFFCP